MYDYRFCFYKPGKKFYTPEEIITTIKTLGNVGYRVKFHSHDPHLDAKNNSIRFFKKETELNVELHTSGGLIDLIIGPAEGKHGHIGLLAMAEEQFEEDPEKNTYLLRGAVLAVSKGIRPYFAWGDHELELDKLEPFLSFDRIGALAWLNFFSQELVERLGGLNKILLHPQDEEYREGATNMLRDFNLTPVVLSPSPIEATSTVTALECEQRYPGALLRSFEVPSASAIEVEP